MGNHTYSHSRMVLVFQGTVSAEVERTDSEIRKTGYRGPITFRPRAVIPRIVSALRADGYRFVTVSDLIRSSPSAAEGSPARGPS